MPVGVVCVRHMGMRMLQRHMLVTVAVFACRHGVVHMVVVAVIVPVGVLVLQRFMGMRVAVGFGQVQDHAGQHQRAAQRHQAAG